MNPSDRSPGRSRLRSESTARAELGPHRGEASADPDADVVRAILRGDSASYGELVTRHQPSLLRLLVGIVSDPHLAEDIAQEVWWIAYRKLDSFGFRSRFRTWLHRIAVREALSTRTRIFRLLSAFAPSESLGAATAPRESGETATNEETLRALARLPAPERAAFALYLEENTYEEIAAALGCPSGTVATHIHRARQRLARAFEDARRVTNPAPGAVPTERETTP